MSQPQLTREQIQKILDDVSFQDRKFLLLDKGDDYLIQMSYMEPDVGKARKWYVSPFMSESEIVETCWAAVQRSQLHIASEYFMYRGKRVYSQHFDIYARLYLCDHNCFDAREPIVQKDPVVTQVVVGDDELKMKRIPFSQLVIELDRLFFGGQITNMGQAEERYETIEAYLEGCGWDWDSIMDEMCHEEAPHLQTKLDN